MTPTTLPNRHTIVKRALLVVIVLAAMMLAVTLVSARTIEASGNPPWPPPSLIMAQKWASTMVAAGGQTFSYTIELRNMSMMSGTVTVTDPLPSEVTYVPDSATGGGAYDAGTRALTWSNVSVAAHSVVRLSFAVTANSVTMPARVLNTARVAAGPFVFHASAWVFIVPASGFPSDLARSFKFAIKPAISSGGTETYTIMLINSSPITAQATVTDPVPSLLTYVPGSATGGGLYDAGSKTLTWSDVAVPPFGHVPLSFAATAPNGIVTPTFVTNIATIASGAQVLQRKAVIVVFNRPVPPPHSILAGSFKMASRRFVAVGETLTYTIKLINSGTDDAVVDVSDPVPDALTYVSDSASNDGTYDPNTHIVAWGAITVPAGSSVPLDFAVEATLAVTRPRLVLNTATITVTGDGSFRRVAPVLLVPEPGSVDVIPPEVHSLTIDDQDVLTSPTVTLHISATDNVSVSQMFIREWQLRTAPGPHWQATHSSGWIPYQPDFDWTLGSTSGAHFVGVWVKDAANNVSHLDRRAVDFASLLLPNTTVARHGVVPYLVYYNANVAVTATLTPLSGDADLYVWFPGNHFWPDRWHTDPLTTTDTITFTTPRAGVYLFVVHGYTAATYNLSIEPGGGPRAEVPNLSVAANVSVSAPYTPNAKTDTLTYDMVLPDSGVDPLYTTSALDPYAVYLPLVMR
jgi:uncharacterized repeat protein (TIGR01451 family)